MLKSCARYGAGERTKLPALLDRLRVHLVCSCKGSSALEIGFSDQDLDIYTANYFFPLSNGNGPGELASKERGNSECRQKVFSFNMWARIIRTGEQRASVCVVRGALTNWSTNKGYG